MIQWITEDAYIDIPEDGKKHEVIIQREKGNPVAAFIDGEQVPIGRKVPKGFESILPDGLGSR